MFWNKSNDIQLTDEMKELILEEIEKQQQQAENEHWLFVVGMASELFPGDNKAVDKVEAAIKNVLTKIHGNLEAAEA